MVKQCRLCVSNQPSKRLNVIYLDKTENRRCVGWCKCSYHVNLMCVSVCLCVFYFCYAVTADTLLVEGNKQEHQLSNLKPSTAYSVALYATKGPLTSGTVITNLQTRTCSFYSAGCGSVMGGGPRLSASQPVAAPCLTEAIQYSI